jgi:phenylpropionate dioxygenase-like ring-hydroxylating dioxygenase large terminal subunit
VGGWGVFGVRDKQGAVQVLRNACRHQNMQVVGTPSGNCETFRCRFHGWTYDLQGRFVSAPPLVAPLDPQSPDIHLASLATSTASGIVFFSLAAPAARPDLGGPPPAYGGTLTTEIACNWKVCVEHLLGEHRPSADFAWHWPLLAVRRAGSVTIMEQVVPHTFLRTRLLTHLFGGSADDHKQAATSSMSVSTWVPTATAADRRGDDVPLSTTPRPTRGTARRPEPLPPGTAAGVRCVRRSWLPLLLHAQDKAQQRATRRSSPACKPASPAYRTSKPT